MWIVLACALDHSFPIRISIMFFHKTINRRKSMMIHNGSKFACCPFDHNVLVDFIDVDLAHQLADAPPGHAQLRWAALRSGAQLRLNINEQFEINKYAKDATTASGWAVASANHHVQQIILLPGAYRECASTHQLLQGDGRQLICLA